MGPVGVPYSRRGKGTQVLKIDHLQLAKVLANRLEAAGFEVRWDDALAGVERFYSEDPFGNRLEFLEGGQGLSQQERRGDDVR